MLPIRLPTQVIILGFALLAAAPAWSAEPKRAPETQLGSQWKTVPQELVNAGISHAGDLDLRKLLRDGEQIKWSEKKSDESPWQANGRKSAYFNADTQTVTITPDVTKDDQEARPQLELHEVMGALKINDHNYSASTALELIRNAKDAVQRDKLIKNLSSGVLNQRNLQTRGGGTSVSGGGDVNALVLKRLVYQSILAETQPSLDFLTNYPDIAFEPDYNPKQQIVSMDYLWRDATDLAAGNTLPTVTLDPSKNYQELIVIRIPALAWRKKSLRKKIIGDLKLRITGMFIVNDKIPLGRYALWSTCKAKNGDDQAPLKGDAASTLVLQIRLTIRAGCRVTDMANMVRFHATYDYKGKPVGRDLELTPVYAKEPPAQAPVKYAGYKCNILVNKVSLVDGQIRVHPEGLSGTVIATPWSTKKSGEVDSTLLARILVEPDGTLGEVVFGLTQLKDQMITVPSSGKTKLSLEVQIGHYKPKLVCERKLVE